MICEHTFDTVYHADSVEWCPIGNNHELIACGTYQLETETKSEEEIIQTRFGRLYLLQATHSSDGKTTLEKIYQADSAGILDIKWCSHPLEIGGESASVFATASADGQLTIHQLVQDESSDIRGKLHAVTSATAAKGLALSLHWSSNEDSYSQNPDIAVSDSEGDVEIFRLEEGGLNFVSKWTAHDHEAWIVAYDSRDSNSIYSGGDDSMLKSWDTRQGCTKPVWAIKKNMGVTSIHCNASRQNLIATGSYDESVDFWDKRMVKKPLFTVSVGGGVWRLKWKPNSGEQIIAAAMHNGVHILDYNSVTGPEIASSYNGHSSMAYGADWSWRENSNLVASCSFYDHSVHLLSFSPANSSE